MKVKGTRGYYAGLDMADAIVEMVNLIYQKATAKRFLSGLMHRLKTRETEFKL